MSDSIVIARDLAGFIVTITLNDDVIDTQSFSNYQYAVQFAELRASELKVDIYDKTGVMYDKQSREVKAFNYMVIVCREDQPIHEGYNVPIRPYSTSLATNDLDQAIRCMLRVFESDKSKVVHVVDLNSGSDDNPYGIKFRIDMFSVLV